MSALLEGEGETVLTDDHFAGTQRADPSALKPLKVRLPLEHVLQLHRMRIVGDLSVSQIVEQALEEYLSGLQSEARSVPRRSREETQ